MVDKIITKITEKESEFSALHTRQDSDKDFYDLKAYTMKTVNGKDNMKDVISITLPRPRTFANWMKTSMLNAVMQLTVEGDGLEDKKTTPIEEFLQAYYEMVDEMLAPRRISSWRAFLAEQACIRGYLATRIYVYKDKDGFHPGLTPYDSRYIVWEYNDVDLEWACPTVMRPRAYIEAKYNEIVASKMGKVEDYYDSKVNVVYIDGKKKVEQENVLGYVPFKITASALGSMFMDDNNIKHSGESIYSAARGLFNEDNRLMSIYQSLTAMSFKGALQKGYENIDNTSAELKGEAPTGLDKVVTYRIADGPYTAMPVSDINNAARLGRLTLGDSLQQASISNVHQGDISQQLSAVAINLLTSLKNIILVPLLRTTEAHMDGCARMVVEQIKSESIIAKVGVIGAQVAVNPGMLKGEYTIRHKFEPVSSLQNIANYSMAEGAAQWVDGDTIRREIIKLPNPSEVKAKWMAEQAARNDPILAMMEWMHSLIDAGKNVEAWRMLYKILQILDRESGGEPPDEIKEPPRGRSMLPMLAGGQGGRAREGEETMLEEDEE